MTPYILIPFINPESDKILCSEVVTSNQKHDNKDKYLDYNSPISRKEVNCNQDPYNLSGWFGSIKNYLYDVRLHSCT